MKITARKTHDFIELKVDDNEETVFKSDINDVEQHIYNLLEVATELASFTNKSLQDYIKQFEL